MEETMQTTKTVKNLVNALREIEYVLYCEACRLEGVKPKRNIDIEHTAGVEGRFHDFINS